MTNKEWMKAMVARFNASETDVDLILINQGLDGTEELNLKKAKTALCKELGTIIPMANVSEGGYSLTWNMDAVKIFYNQLCNELGITPASKPVIRNASNRW